MVSILGLVSLYGVLTLQRVTLAHVGCVLRAMGLHSSRQHSMDPQRYSESACDSSIGRGRCTWFTFGQPAPQLYHALSKWLETCMLMWHHLHHHLRPYKWTTSILKLLGDPWGHLCALTAIGSTTGLLCGSPTHHFGTYGLHHTC